MEKIFKLSAIMFINVLESAMNLLKGGGFIMLPIFGVGFFAWILVLNGNKEHRKAVLSCAAVAPLMGLLGTVTGMVKTFETISQFGFGNPVLLADGISEALITTQAGLLVAFPLLLAQGRLK